MIIQRLCILGGTGFVGRTLANRLSQDGYQIRVLTRRRLKNSDDLIVLPTVDLIEADVHNPQHLKACFQDCDAVINLVGILNERGRNGKGFYSAHVELAEKIASTCNHLGIKRVLQMSALNADAENGASHYLKTKGQAEEVLHGNKDLFVSSYRPSVIFGQHDSFFNRFANLLKITPLFFPLACAGARFAPVFVEDVAEVMAQTLNDSGSYNQRYSLCGPEEYSLLDLVRFTVNTLALKRSIIPLNDFFSRLQAAVFDFVPGKPFSTDNYLSTKVDSVCFDNAFNKLNIRPKNIKTIVVDYLQTRSRQNDFDRFRKIISIE